MALHLKPRRTKVPVEHMAVNIPHRHVPKGLQRIRAVVVQQASDHPAITPATGDYCDGTVVTVVNGMVELYKGEGPIPAPQMGGVPAADGTRFLQKQRLIGVIRNEDENGHPHDHEVHAGSVVCTNKDDGTTWAMPAEHAQAWFEPDEEGK